MSGGISNSTAIRAAALILFSVAIIFVVSNQNRPTPKVCPPEKSPEKIIIREQILVTSPPAPPAIAGQQPVAPPPIQESPVAPAIPTAQEPGTVRVIREQAIQYAPSPFQRGEPFVNGETPLTMLRDKKVPKTPLPDNWDGGYGWKFIQYEPSKFESDWYAFALDAWNRGQKQRPKHPGHLCAGVKGQFRAQFAAYWQQLPRMAPNVPKRRVTTRDQCQPKPTDPMEFDHNIFSRFKYEYRCMDEPCITPPPANGPAVGTIKYTYIEPLVGHMRQPRYCYNMELFNKNYMLVDPWPLFYGSRSTISPKIKTLYLDAGASTWDEGGGGASQSWFYEIYSDFCLYFEDWYMWELIDWKPADVFKKLPGFIKSGYRWFNIPLTTGDETWDNPLNQLLLEAKKEDVVIFKIDFDAPLIEMALINKILEHKEISDLIDELYFEHHVWMEHICGAWGNCGTPESVPDSIRVFQGLRERGIRSHSWV